MGETQKLSKSEIAKDKRLREIYNTTLEAQNEQRATQKNACAICRRPFSQFQAYQDHDHKCCPRRLKRYCGKCNRSLLCYICNKKAVGIIEYLIKLDIDPQKVVDYYKEWNVVIAAKGGYAPKEKISKAKARRRVPQKQSSV